MFGGNVEKTDENLWISRDFIHKMWITSRKITEKYGVINNINRVIHRLRI